MPPVHAPSPPGLFITGTDTGVGKTYITALIARSLAAEGKRVGVYKPVASGCSSATEEAQDDATILWRAAQQPGELRHVCPQRFARPLAPHLAAAAEGLRIDRRLLRSGLEYWRERSEVILVEGAGGLLSPLCEDEYVANLAAEFALPLVIVAANRLGTINATLQTLYTAGHIHGGLRVASVVLNDTHPDPADLSRESNFRELQARCQPPLTAVAHTGQQFTPPIDWFRLAQASLP